MSLKEAFSRFIHRPKDKSKEDEADVHALGVLYENDEIVGDSDACNEEIDIITVHGLNGGYRRTWKHPETGIIWTQELLPRAFPRSRIMSYGFDAGVQGGRNVLHMMQHAEDLLSQIRSHRMTEATRSRKIIFVGHSLGGILVKKALVQAREEEQFKTIVESTVGVMFMAVPHNGTDVAKLASDIASIAKTVTSLNTANMELLQRESVPLQEISRSFGFIDHMKIATVVESQKTRIPYTGKHILVVPHSSARLFLGNRESFNTITDADHHMVCKFRGADDLQYMKVRRALLDLAQNEIKSSVISQHIPYSRDKRFIGRQETIARILRESEPCRVHSRMSLYGLGGIGKSGIAIEAAYSYVQKFPARNVFWVYGSSRIRFEQSYRSIAAALGIMGADDPKLDVLSKVQYSLENSPARWLIIVDNMNDESLYFKSNDSSCAGSVVKQGLVDNMMPLSAYLPQSKNVFILATSRTRTLSLQLVDYEVESVVEIGALAPDESFSLVHNRLSKKNNFSEEIPHFVALLGNIPLAITQACAYIEMNPLMSIMKYCKLFRENEASRRRLLKSNAPDIHRDSDLPDAVIQTWQLSFKNIQSHHKLAADMLCFLGTLDNQNIPIYLLDEIGNDGIEIGEALSCLLSFCMVKLGADGDYLEIHELVMIAIEDWLRESQQLYTWLPAAGEAIIKEIPGDVKIRYELWQKFAELIPHVRKVVNFWEGFPGGMIIKAELTGRLGFFSSLRSEHKETITLHREAADIYHIVEGHAGRNTLTHRVLVAEAVQNIGQLDEAEKEYRDVIDCTEKCENSTDDLQDIRYQSSIQLAYITAERGNLGEAIHSMKELYESAIKVRGESDEITSQIMHNYANLLARDDKHEDAGQLHRLALENLWRKKPPETAAIAVVTRRLADNLIHQGEFEEASALISKAFDIQKNVLPRGHPELVATLKLRAHLYHSSKQHEFWEGMLREAKAEAEAFLEYPVASEEIYNELAASLIEREKFEDAEIVMREMFEKHNLTKTPQSDKSLTYLQNFSFILGKVGKLDEAEVMCWQILKQSVGLEIPGKHHKSEDAREARYALGTLKGILGIECSSNDPSSVCSEVMNKQKQSLQGQPRAIQERAIILGNFLIMHGWAVQGSMLKVECRDTADDGSLWFLYHLAVEHLQRAQKAVARDILSELLAACKTQSAPRITLQRAAMNLLGITLEPGSDEAIAQFKDLTALRPDRSLEQLMGLNNLAYAFDSKGMCQEALNTHVSLKAIIDSGDRWTKNQKLVVQGLMKYFQQFLHEHKTDRAGHDQLDYDLPLNDIDLSNQQEGPMKKFAILEYPTKPCSCCKD